MADIYVSNSGSVTSPYDTWATAHDDMEAVLEGIAASGDRIFMSHTFSQGTVGSLTISSSLAGEGEAIIIMSVDATGSPEPPLPADITAGAEIDCTAFLNISNLEAHWHGITFRSQNSMTIGTSAIFRYYDCTFHLDSTNGAHFMSMGRDNTLHYIEKCKFRFGDVGQHIETGSSAHFEFVDCELHASSAAIEHLFQCDQTRGGTVRINGFDLSGADSTGTFDLIERTGQTLNVSSGHRMWATGVRLPALGGWIRTSIVASAENFNFWASGTGTGVENIFSKSLYAETTDDSTTYLDGEYLDGSSYSLKCDSVADTSPGFRSGIVDLGPWVADANPTITVEVTTDSTLDDQKLWLEVIYPASGSTMRHLLTTRPDGFGLGTAGSLTTSSATWTSAKTNKYSLSITVSGGQAGVHDVIVHFAPGAAQTIYIDPKVTVT